jgi:hypothetical protein
VQIHDFEPGIAASGLFWTTPMRENAVRVDLEDGTARLRAQHFAIPDFHDFCSSLSGGPTVPATVSFELDWGGAAASYGASDRTFVLRGLRTDAMIEWSARESGFEFRSDPAHTSRNIFSAIGEERNGVFRN